MTSGTKPNSLESGFFETRPLDDPEFLEAQRKRKEASRKDGPKYKHYCKEWDFLEIDADSPEYEACICEIDSDGKGPAYKQGDRVYVLPCGVEATVIRQVLHHDGPEAFWGNLELQYDDGKKGMANSWQCSKV